MFKVVRKNIMFLVIVSLVAVVLAVIIGRKSMLKNAILTVTVQLSEAKPEEVDFSEIEKRAEKAIFAVENELLSMDDFRTLDSLLALMLYVGIDSTQFMNYLKQMDPILGIEHVPLPINSSDAYAQ